MILVFINFAMRSKLRLIDSSEQLDGGEDIGGQFQYPQLHSRFLCRQGSAALSRTRLRNKARLGRVV